MGFWWVLLFIAQGDGCFPWVYVVFVGVRGFSRFWWVSVSFGVLCRGFSWVFRGFP